MVNALIVILTYFKQLWRKNDILNSSDESGMPLNPKSEKVMVQKNPCCLTGSTKDQITVAPHYTAFFITVRWPLITSLAASEDVLVFTLSLNTTHISQPLTRVHFLH